MITWTQRERVKPDPLIRSQRYIAAEIEVACAGPPVSGRSLDDIVQQWEAAVVHDGSLGASGFEINTAPAIGSLFTNQVNDICDALTRQGSAISAECGCHIHVDARDFGWYEIKRLIQLYAVIEPALYAMVPTNRRVSRYCYPCGQKFLTALQTGTYTYVTTAKDFTNLSQIQRDKLQKWLDTLPAGHHAKLTTVKRMVKLDKTHSIEIEQQRFVLEHAVHQLRQAIVMAVYDRPFKDKTALATKQNKRGQHRYRTLNLHSWFHRGTIEWRLAEGTIDPMTIRMWGAVFSRILDVAYQTPEPVLLAMCRQVSFDETQTDGQVTEASVRLLCQLVPEADGWIQARIQRYIREPSATSRLRVSLPSSNTRMDADEAPRRSRSWHEPVAVDAEGRAMCDVCGGFYDIAGSMWRPVYGLYICNRNYIELIDGQRLTRAENGAPLRLLRSTITRMPTTEDR